MAEKKENALSAKSSVTSSDFLRLVGSNGVSYKQLVTDVAKYILENYAGSSLAGSSQAPKTAIDALKTSVDSLNSKIAGTSWAVITDTPVSYCKRGNIVFVKISNASVGTTWTSLATLPTGYRPNASITASGSAGTYGKLHMGVLLGTGGAIQASCSESRSDGHALIAFPV